MTDAPPGADPGRRDAEAGDWPKRFLAANRTQDAADPADAVRILLAVPEGAAIDPSSVGRDIAMADECDRQQLAFDVVRDLLGAHEAVLELPQPAPTRI